ncbi:hypothetical protein VKT23_013610 [Stygiomarasmius scandens]|uniref:F-box domain-containing protein n=1 Tax=Marasmiellus scandens TaxID=2682957 RepID=A0ABR1J5J8_9AGAR
MCAQILTAYDDIPLLPIDPSQFRAPYPSDAKVSQVQQQIHDARSLIDQCDLEIGRLRSTISLLEEQKKRITRRIDEYHALISPVRKIPVEIWTEIFSIFLEDSCNLHITYYKISLPTLRLSHVCGFWRTIVMSTPKLWSNLDVNIMHGRDEMVEAVSFYLDRSKTAPLCLKLTALTKYGHEVYPDRFGSRSWQAFKLLLDVHTRWFKVKLNFRWQVLNDREIEGHLKTMSTYCNILQSFSITMGDTSSPEPCPHLFRLLERAPQLQSFSSNYFDKSFTLSFYNLVDISVGSLLAEDMLFYLSICPKLERADFAVVNFNRHANARPVCHTRLCSLKCFFESDIAIADTFMGLTLPALSRLELSTRGNQRENRTSLQDLLLRSRCPLKYLNLDSDTFTCDQELAEILSLTPKLTHLELDPYHGLTTASFQSLTLEDGKLPLLPQLESFHSQLYPPFPEPEAILLMVKSRGQNKRLESFTFIAEYYLTLVDQWERGQWLTSRAEPGLQILEEWDPVTNITQMQITVSS